MKSIWKYEVPIEGMFKISMPKGAEIIAFQVQHEKPCIWAIVNTDAELTIRTFAIIETGHPFTENPGKYIGTIQMAGGNLVWHLFEIIE